MTPEMKALIAAVRKHSIEHYNTGGWDYVVECWEDSEIEAVLKGKSLRFPKPVTTAKEAIERMARQIGPLAEQRSEAISAGGGCPECLSFQKHEEGCSKRGKWPLENDQ